MTRPLSICPDCDRAFANRNQTHTCGLHDLDRHFEGKAPIIREIYEAFLALLESIGPVTVLPEKTRIAFQTRMSFAQLTPKPAWVDGHLVLARAVRDPLFRKVETISARNHVHFFRLSAPSDLTRRFRAFAKEAYAVGRQEHLRTPRR